MTCWREWRPWRQNRDLGFIRDNSYAKSSIGSFHIKHKWAKEEETMEQPHAIKEMDDPKNYSLVIDKCKGWHVTRNVEVLCDVNLSFGW